jgi:hypothetical protein
MHGPACRAGAMAADTALSHSGSLATSGTIPHPYPLRVWNGIFTAGDGHAKTDLKTISLRRDRKSETSAREKWPQKRPSCLKVLTSGFRKSGLVADAVHCEPVSGQFRKQQGKKQAESKVSPVKGFRAGSKIQQTSMFFE